MKLSLSTNISKLRKEHAMTQEQLAQALGVTFASVSKWERGIATPELHLIAQLADLFEVSIDALIGYQFRNNDRQAVIARLKQYFHDRDNDDVYPDIENALKRYPNCFAVVYNSARIYQVRGLVRNRIEFARRALSLYRQACMLIGQNTDPEISEISIRREMAQVYLDLGEYETGLELLKQYNPCRLNHSLIGQTLSANYNNPDGALPYLSMALLDMTQTQMELVTGYLNVYCKTGQYQQALDVTDWALAFFPGLRNPEKQTYMDKSEAVLWASRAEILLNLGRKEDARHDLRQAKTIAQRFDDAPSYDAASIRFAEVAQQATSFDDMGETAMRSLDNFVAQCNQPQLLDLWNVIKAET